IRCCSADLLAVHRKCQQNVARSPAHKEIARIDIERSVHDDRTGSVDRASVGLHPVNSREVALGVYVPYDAAIDSRISPQVTVQTAGEGHSRDRGHGCRLSRAATWLVSAAGMWSAPDNFSGPYVQREQPATCGRIELEWHSKDRPLSARGAQGRRLGIDVRHSGVDVLAVRGRSPLHSAEPPAFADAPLP